MTTEEVSLFDELVNALLSWRVDTSGEKKYLWMHKWDIHCLMAKYHLDTIVKWLEYHKDPNNYGQHKCNSAKSTSQIHRVILCVLPVLRLL